ncbi:uncharacterized protein [Nicotiana tomentosiformis]|uniref:uncharacterized protein n=1 Tax=Nicotiana tomentosiformis TaxID=4098 RepID=UPI00388C6D71
MADDEQRRLARFGRLRPLSFSGAELEDAQGFLDRCERMLRTTGILETSGVSFTTFQFSGTAFRWWEAYERRREELRRQFEQLRQDGMSLTQYEMRFSELARHAVWLVPTDKERIRRFIEGLTYQLRLLMTRERVSGATFDEVVDIARHIEMVRSQERGEREAKRPHGPGDFSDVPSGGQFYRGRGRPYRHAQTGRPVHHGASFSHGLYSYHQDQSSLSALSA